MLDECHLLSRTSLRTALKIVIRVASDAARRENRTSKEVKKSPPRRESKAALLGGGERKPGWHAETGDGRRARIFLAQLQETLSVVPHSGSSIRWADSVIQSRRRKATCDVSSDGDRISCRWSRRIKLTDLFKGLVPPRRRGRCGARPIGGQGTGTSSLRRHRFRQVALKL